MDFKISNEWLNEISETTITTNPNCIATIKKIPTYFDTDDLYTCMMLAFNFGNSRGRECERDHIHWNSVTTFQYMKIYSKDHDGKLPDTFADLKEYEKQREEYHDRLINENIAEVKRL